MNAIIEKINQALAEVERRAGEAADAAAVEQLRIDYLGRNGLFPALSREMGQVPPEERRETGSAFNSGRGKIQELIENAAARLKAAGSGSGDAIDLTLEASSAIDDYETRAPAWVRLDGAKR